MTFADTIRKIYNTRLDIALGHIPEDRRIVTKEEAIWIKNYTILDMLGPEGRSLDESDVDDVDQRIYCIRTMHWWNRHLLRTMMEMDQDKITENGYGNSRAGNPARLHKQ